MQQVAEQVQERKPLDVARLLGPNPRWPQFVGAWHFIKVTMYGAEGYTLDQYDAAQEWGRLLAEWSMGKWGRGRDERTGTRRE